MKTEMDKKNVVSDGRVTGMRSTIISDLMNVTWRMTVPTVLGLFIGMGIDTLLKTSPAGFLIGAALGFAAGLYLALRLLKEVRENEQ